MSRVAILTDRFEEMFAFYQTQLGFTLVQSWDREGARGVVLKWWDGMRIELLDTRREKSPPVLGLPSERIQLVLIHPRLASFLGERGWGPAQRASWSTCFFRTRDPDGHAICLMEPESRDEPEPPGS